MRRLFNYLNPIAHLGEKNYSVKPALITSLALVAILEVYANEVIKNPNASALPAIFLFIFVIIYFSFRSGINGGLTATGISVLYYFYIVVSRNEAPEEQNTQFITALILGGLHLFLTFTIGWLKETIDDLIEREANEKRRLQTVIDQLPVGVLITDSVGRVVQGNKQIEKILGRKIQNYTLHEKIPIENEQMNGARGKPNSWPLTQVLNGKKDVVSKELDVFHESGKKVHVQASATIIHNRRGEVIAAASIINDITEKKEMEERKDDFVNMASHELKTPITSMKLYLESLSRRIEGQDDKAAKTLQNIKEQANKLQELASDLLDVSRLQTGKLSFSREKFRIDELVEQTIDELQVATNNQQIILEQRPKVLVFADRFRIYQVLTNLITNASKYSPQGSDIRVSLKKTDGKIKIGVKDQGIGIAKEQQKKIFDRLYQVTDPTEKTFPGLGMGLYISKEIVRRHKGKIWVESEKGKGSTFYFTLPVTKR